MQIQRQTFYTPQRIIAAVQKKVAAALAHGEAIDYLTLVPDGEPTLDAHLTELLLALKPLSIPLAVITNASLLNNAAVQSALMHADWVSLKIDAVDESTWRRIDRPHGHLQLVNILKGAQDFARTFNGRLVTETMLVAGVNDSPTALQATAATIATLNPAVAYLSVPTRPPAESWVHPPDATALNTAYQTFIQAHAHVELLIGYEGNSFASTGDSASSGVAADLLNITAVHPMRQDAIATFLAQTNADWDLVHNLIQQNYLLPTTYQGQTFYLRHLSKTEN